MNCSAQHVEPHRVRAPSLWAGLPPLSLSRIVERTQSFLWLWENGIILLCVNKKRERKTFSSLALFERIFQLF